MPGVTITHSGILWVGGPQQATGARCDAVLSENYANFTLHMLR